MVASLERPVQYKIVNYDIESIAHVVSDWHNLTGESRYKPEEILGFEFDNPSYQIRIKVKGIGIVSIPQCFYKIKSWERRSVQATSQEVASLEEWEAIPKAKRYRWLGNGWWQDSEGGRTTFYPYLLTDRQFDILSGKIRVI